MSGEPKQPFPSLTALETLIKIAEHLPARSKNVAAEKCGLTYQGMARHLKNFKRHCGEEILVEDGASGETALSHVGLQLVEYARAVLANHRLIRSWPPTHEIFVGATHRTATAFLPAFLAAFLEALVEAGQRLPQITVQESDSEDVFWDRLQTGQSDFGLRGFPVDDSGEVRMKKRVGITFSPVSGVFKPFVVSRTRKSGPVTMAEVVREGRVGILRVNLEDVIATIRAGEPNLIFPQPGVIVCESHMALMSMILSGVWHGLVFLPPGLTLRKPLFQREVTDLGLKVKVFVATSSRTVRVPASAAPPDRPWRREHLLAKLKMIFDKPDVQQRAFEPNSESLPIL